METEISLENLPPTVDFDWLHHLLEPYGYPKETILFRGTTEVRALVVMGNSRAALNAIEELDGSFIQDRLIRVRLALPVDSQPIPIEGPITILGVLVLEVHVSNLPSQTTRGKLKSLFRRFPVGKIRMRMQRREAFVQLAVGDRGLEKAIEELDG